MSKKEEKIDITAKLREFHNAFTELQDSLPNLAYSGLTSEQISLFMKPLQELKIKYLQLECDVYDALRQECRESNNQGYEDGKALVEIVKKYAPYQRPPRIWGLV